ncbi:hypothetical protein [Streptosporangium sp. NPDC002524]|uniref:hypothetical protein n=1 Tax=Streptosporangium sp. NPDC002524 TaxID=3154537 RepID=UPI0033290BED
MTNTTVGIDFDVPLHRYRQGWHDGTIYDEPTPGGLEALRTLMGQHAVFIFTARNDLQAVAAWLIRHGIPAATLYDLRMAEGLQYSIGTFWTRRDVVLVTDQKYPAVAYIDDRGIRWESWPQALADLRAVLGEDDRLTAGELLAAAAQRVMDAEDGPTAEEVELAAHRVMRAVLSDRELKIAYQRLTLALQRSQMTDWTADSGDDELGILRLSCGHAKLWHPSLVVVDGTTLCAPCGEQRTATRIVHTPTTPAPAISKETP